MLANSILFSSLTQFNLNFRKIIYNALKISNKLTE